MMGRGELMADRLENGHVLTDEDVDTAQLIKQINDQLGLVTDDTTMRIAATPPSHVRKVVSQATFDDGQSVSGPQPLADARRREDWGQSS
jgi:hypothetical protein